MIQAAYTASAEPAARSTGSGGSAPVSGDPYGFMAWLNATRASYGLGAVGYDADL